MAVSTPLSTSTRRENLSLELYTDANWQVAAPLHHRQCGFVRCTSKTSHKPPWCDRYPRHHAAFYLPLFGHPGTAFLLFSMFSGAHLHNTKFTPAFWPNWQQFLPNMPEVQISNQEQLSHSSSLHQHYCSKDLWAEMMVGGVCTQIGNGARVCACMHIFFLFV